MSSLQPPPMSTTSYPFDESIAAIRAHLPAHLAAPKIGIVCGSGLSTLASRFKDKVEVPYNGLPGFVESTVAGHKSAFAFGLLGDTEDGKGVPVVAMLGRFHPYEGHPLGKATYPIRVMKRLGVENLIITNATGSLNPSIPVGTIVVIHDHLSLPSLTGLNPLMGPSYPPYLRFLPMSNAYSRTLRKLVFRAAHSLGLPHSALAEGTYAWVSGPTYETPAEGRFLRNAGADVVGMSTIPEVIVAREEGLEVTVLSLVTNFVVIPDKYKSVREEVEAEIAGTPLPAVVEQVVSHEEVLAIGVQKADVLRQIIETIVAWI